MWITLENLTSEGVPNWAIVQKTKGPNSFQKEVKGEGWGALYPLKEVSAKGKSETVRQCVKWNIHYYLFNSPFNIFDIKYRKPGGGQNGDWWGGP